MTAKKKILNLLLTLLFSPVLLAQDPISSTTETMVFQPEYNQCQNLNIHVPADKVVFVFYTPKPLEIKHDAMADYKQQVSAFNQRYGAQTLTIPYEGPNGTIILKYRDIKSSISYGWVQGAKNKYPGEIKPGHHYCIKVAFKKKLSYIDKTYEIDKKIQTLTGNDAEIIIKTIPKKLKFNFKEKPYIRILKTTESNNNGEYHLLIKPNISDQSDRIITIVKDGYANLSIDLGKVPPKDYRYIIIKDESYTSDKILIKSQPAGATIKIIEIPDLHPVTDYVFKSKPGTYHFTLEKPGYKTYTGKFTIGNEREINIKLEPRLGKLTIPGDHNSRGAKVYVDDKPIGNIPIYNYKIKIGTHKLKVFKDKSVSDKALYHVHIKENETTTFTDFKISPKKKIHIVITPVKKAEVYIDGNLITNKTNFDVVLGVGNHEIIIEAPNYQPLKKQFEVNQYQNKFYFELRPVKYHVVFDAVPFAKVYIDGRNAGLTPYEAYLPVGYYHVVYKHPDIITKRKTYHITKDEKFKVHLYHSYFTGFGLSYGASQFNYNLSFAFSQWYLDIGYGGLLKINKVEEEDITLQNVNIDIADYDKEFGRVYKEGKDNTGRNLRASVGYMTGWPFPIIFNVGYSIMTTPEYYRVYKAKYDYTYSGSSTVILSKGELFSNDELYTKKINSITAGIAIPIANTIIIGARYYMKTQTGKPGYAFHASFILYN